MEPNSLGMSVCVSPYHNSIKKAATELKFCRQVQNGILTKWYFFVSRFYYCSQSYCTFCTVSYTKINAFASKTANAEPIAGKICFYRFSSTLKTMSII